MPTVRWTRVAGIALAVATLTACAASPTTTYTDESGRELTVNWVDYPGHAYTDVDQVLAAPDHADVEPASDALLADARTALASAGEFSWKTDGEGRWFSESGNGYGGDSWHVSYNSESWVTDGAPRDWREAIDALSEVTNAHGLGPVVLEFEHDENPYPASDEEALHQFGTTDPDAFWSWNGSAFGQGQWLTVGFVDVDRAPTSEIAAGARELAGDRSASAYLQYGVTTLPQGERAAFEEALAPFDGLALPRATTSD